MKISVNGQDYSVSDEKPLLSVLRDEIGMLSFKEGCDDATCGTCARPARRVVAALLDREHPDLVAQDREQWLLVRYRVVLAIDADLHDGAAPLLSDVAVGWTAGHELSGGEIVRKRPVANDVVAAEEDVAHPALDLSAFVWRVVHVVMELVMTDGPAWSGVVDDDVGVTAGQQSPFAGIEAEVPCRVLRRDCNEALRRHPLCRHTVGVEEHEPELDSRRTVRDLGEVRRLVLLSVQVERAVVRADELDVPVSEPGPQRVEILRSAQRWAHGVRPDLQVVVLGGAVEAVVKQEVLGTGLGDNLAATLARPTYFLDGLPSAEVDDVVLGVEQLRDHGQPTERLALESRRSGALVVEGARVAAIQLLADECIDHQPILAVEADGGTRTRARREGGVDLVVVDHHRVPIGHIHLERGDPGLDDLGHLVSELRAPLRHRQVEAVVGDGAALGLFVPPAHTLHETLAVELGCEVEDRRGSTGTRSALAGGTTTVLDFATQFHGERLMDGVRRWHEKARGRAVTDYGFHLAMTQWRPEFADEMAEVVAAGVTSFKMYMAYRDSMMVDDDEIYAALSASSRAGATIGFHCENGLVIDALVREELGRGHTGAFYHQGTRPPALEREALSRLSTIAGLLDAQHYIVHLSAGETLEEVRRARQRGSKVVAETCPQYLLLDDSLYGTAESDDLEVRAYVMSPPLRAAENLEALWAGLAEGDIQFVGTDHCSFNLHGQKDQATDFTRIPNGAPGIELRLALLYTYGVAAKRISAERFVAVTAENAARYFGLYPRKGTLLPGSDVPFRG